MLCSDVDLRFSYFFFFFNDPATPEIYTLSLHDALPISSTNSSDSAAAAAARARCSASLARFTSARSEEHTSELQSLTNLVCRLLLEKKKKQTNKKRREQHNTPRKLCSERTRNNNTNSNT